MQPLIIHWFRQDLRLADNPALSAAAAAGTVLPIYILDDVHAGEFAAGGASRVWLHHSLKALQRSLHGQLAFFRGDAAVILPQLIAATNATAVSWTRCYEPWRLQRDQKIKQALKAQNITVHSHNGSLLWEPWTVTKADGTPYKVFTPFYKRGCLQAPLPRKPLSLPAELQLAALPKTSLRLEELQLLPKISWDKSMMQHWIVGEEAAHQRLHTFLKDEISHYKTGRNYPAQPAVSRLSPHLHFGEISPNQAWYAAKQVGDNQNIATFCSELGWREFSYSLLYHFPQLPQENWQAKFNRFPWNSNPTALQQWQRGQTGFPIIDAGMRQLWQTGYMHNRVRMIVASFLVKNLLIDWRDGERWFWDCLVDADLASNSASWQWVAGCGADAAPYFRIFNPVTQGEKFDADGVYTKQFVPELARLPSQYLFSPWLAPASVLQEAGIILGTTYPHPMVDLKISRQAALTALATLKSE